MYKKFLSLKYCHIRLSGIFYFLAFLILVLLAHPFYLKQSVYKWVYDSTLGNEITLIKIYNYNNPLEITTDNDDSEITYRNSSSKHIEIELPIANTWEKHNITIKSKGKEKLQIRLSAPSSLDEYGYEPILVDYKDFSIDGKSLNIPKKSLWVDDSYDSPMLDIKKGQTINISIRARQHHLRLKDFQLLFNYKKWELISVISLIGTILTIIICLMFVYLHKLKHLFCFIVFISLILPALYITQKDISLLENRGLSKFPNLLSARGINEKFGEEFNNWFSDRFGGRIELINSRFFILYHINNKIANEKAFIADDDWKFPTKGIKKINSVNYQRQKNMKIINGLKKMNDSMRGKDIEFYIVLEPSRSELYKKYWDKYYPHIPYYDYVQDLKDAFYSDHNIHFIDLKDKFERSKNYFRLYDKNDHHMTLAAVNIMIDEIVQTLDRNLEKEYRQTISYVDKKCKLYSFLNYYDDNLAIKTVPDNEMCKKIVIPKSKVKSTEIEIGINEATNPNPLINRDLFILFPCYEEFIFPILKEFYAHTISVNYNVFDDHDEEVLKEHAISKLKSIKPGTVVLIFLSHPTEFNISKTNTYLEAY